MSKRSETGFKVGDFVTSVHEKGDIDDFDDMLKGGMVTHIRESIGCCLVSTHGTRTNRDAPWPMADLRLMSEEEKRRFTEVLIRQQYENSLMLLRALGRPEDMEQAV